MKLVALVESAEHVCCRYRIAAFRPAFEQAGYDLHVEPLPRSLWGRLQLYRSLRSADAVILQRRLLPGVELALLRRKARRLLFDFDDAIWLRDSYSTKGFESAKRSRRFAAIIRAADAVIAGNPVLAAEARRFAARDAVAVIPTCIDPESYPLAEPRPGGPVRLVWVGSSSTLQGLERFCDVLEAIGAAVPGLRLKLICDRFVSLKNLPVDPVPWSAATEAAELASSTIGIGWVPDDPWSRGKCGLKILQYQAAGLPVVANPVGVQAEFVTNNVTGFVAETREQWVDAIRRLEADAGLRRRLGLAGRRQVEQRYSVAVGGQLWLDRLLRPTVVPTAG